MSDQSAVFGPGSHPSFHEELDAQKKRAKQLRWDTYFLGALNQWEHTTNGRKTKNDCCFLAKLRIRIATQELKENPMNITTAAAANAAAAIRAVR